MGNKYTLAAAINLSTLILGLGIGFFVGSAYPTRVLAQAPQTPSTKVEEVTPGASVGSFATGLLLAHQVETDTLIVNGIDVLKLNEGILNYLATRPLAERADIQNIIDRSKPETFYRVKEQQPAPQTPKNTPQPEQKEKPKP